MYYRLILFCIFVSFYWGSLEAAPSEFVSQHIVQIMATKCLQPERVRHATGFVIAESLGIPGWGGAQGGTKAILTTMHSVAGCELSLYTASGSGSYKGRLKFVNPGLDLAVVELPSELRSMKPLQLKSGVSEGTTVDVVGCGGPRHSCEQRPSKTGAVVTFEERAGDAAFRRRGSPARQTKFVTVPWAVNGDSGAPVIDSNQQVLGVVVWGASGLEKNTSYWNFAVVAGQPTTDWREWKEDRMSAWDINWQKTEGYPALYSSSLFEEIPLPNNPLRTLEFALVSAPSSFLMAANETSLFDWSEYLRAKGRKSLDLSTTKEKFPAIVSANDAAEFCKWLRPDLRLPSVSEWTTAVEHGRSDLKPRLASGEETSRDERADTSTTAPGRRITPARAPSIVDCRCVNSVGEQAVKCPDSDFTDTTSELEKNDVTPRNGLGIRDLLGNAWEWANDDTSKRSSIPPRLVQVGGSFESHCKDLTDSPPPTRKNGYAGFRCVLPFKAEDQR